MSASGLVVDWYCWFNTAATWYGHVILDWKEPTEPGAHWEGLQAMIMQQEDLISCSLDLSLSSPSLIFHLLFLQTLFTFIYISFYATTDCLIHLLSFWIASCLSSLIQHKELGTHHPLLENTELIWPVKINMIDQTKFPNWWEVRTLSPPSSCSCLFGSHVKWVCAALLW